MIMYLDYEQAQHFEGQMIQYKNKKGKWVIGKVAKVRKDGLEIEELKSSISSEGYGFGFWGPGPFFGPPAFVPFVGVAFNPFFLW
jgi:hypothetical protein